MLDGDRVAIVLLSAIGDVVHAFPLVSSLASAAPLARIEWGVQPALATLAARHPAVRRTSLATLILDARRKLGFDRRRAPEGNWLATSERSGPSATPLRATT